MEFSEQAQTRFCQKVSEAMGFDFDYGRMDASTHPFSAGLWKGDTRFTTRFDEKDPFSCLYAVMHETGHALYEQGLHPEHSLRLEDQQSHLESMNHNLVFGKTRLEEPVSFGR